MHENIFWSFGNIQFFFIEYKINLLKPLQDGIARFSYFITCHKKTQSDRVCLFCTMLLKEMSIKNILTKIRPQRHFFLGGGVGGRGWCGVGEIEGKRGRKVGRLRKGYIIGQCCQFF